MMSEEDCGFSNTKEASPAPPPLLLDPKNVYNYLTLGMIQSLEKRPNIVDIRLNQQPPCEQAAILQWEAESGCSMPLDLSNFYKSFNGFQLVWTCLDAGHVIPVGQLTINRIEQLTKLQSPRKTISGFEECVAMMARSDESAPDPIANKFHLATVADGSRVVLSLAHNDLSIWLLDNARDWHYLANSFTEYFRLMVLNLGLPCWQHVVADIPLPPTAEPWFWMFMPLARSLKTGVGTSFPKSTPVSQPDVKVELDRVLRPRSAPSEPNAQQHDATKVNTPQPPSESKRQASLKRGGSKVRLKNLHRQ
eukprot:TRINITY_DN14189_c0_g1_i1.p1 TRINITY_DN14189_c0_g1~~TRINITY_DN14189_c0_g1_i1.p1  ORF type:complete len:307 (+),score=36.04 TRINITY_DN14189_c0_g1_i1:63-983(+)